MQCLRRVITQPLCEVVCGSYPELGQGLCYEHTERKCVLGKVVRLWWALGLFGPSLGEACLSSQVVAYRRLAKNVNEFV
jgi:hypothetical protein